MDRDRDGFLVPKDSPSTTPDRFQSIDRNGDGKVSLGEAVGDKVIDFFDADQNKDGVMSLAELLNFERNLGKS